jgi:hypothetical protein
MASGFLFGVTIRYAVYYDVSLVAEQEAYCVPIQNNARNQRVGKDPPGLAAGSVNFSDRMSNGLSGPEGPGRRWAAHFVALAAATVLVAATIDR